jgi:hypothetical protein
VLQGREQQTNPAEEVRIISYHFRVEVSKFPKSFGSEDGFGPKGYVFFSKHSASPDFMKQLNRIL